MCAEVENRVISVHTCWCNRYGESNGDDFIEVWRFAAENCATIASSILDADSQLQDAFTEAGIDSPEDILTQWLMHELQFSFDAPDLPDDVASVLSYWEVWAMNVNG